MASFKIYNGIRSIKMKSHSYIGNVLKCINVYFANEKNKLKQQKNVKYLFDNKN